MHWCSRAHAAYVARGIVEATQHRHVYTRIALALALPARQLRLTPPTRTVPFRLRMRGGWGRGGGGLSALVYGLCLPLPPNNAQSHTRHLCDSTFIYECFYSMYQVQRSRHTSHYIDANLDKVLSPVRWCEMDVNKTLLPIDHLGFRLRIEGAPPNTATDGLLKPPIPIRGRGDPRYHPIPVLLVFG